MTIDALTVRVQPKTPISRVMWMMGYVRDPAWWSQHTALADTDTDLVAALAEAFVIAAERATARGLLSGYREVEDSGPVLRGRLRAGDQITRRFFARTAWWVIRYDEYGRRHRRKPAAARRHPDSARFRGSPAPSADEVGQGSPRPRRRHTAHRWCRTVPGANEIERALPLGIAVGGADHRASVHRGPHRERRRARFRRRHVDSVFRIS